MKRISEKTADSGVLNAGVTSEPAGDVLVDSDPLSGEEGANLVEYALLAALIAIVCISAMSFLGGQTSQTLQSVGEHLGKAVGSS